MPNLSPATDSATRGPGNGVAALLTADALYEILLRLPAKDLCRLRAVCLAWRSLLSDPRFAAAHAAHHRGPLIVTGYDRCRNCPYHPNEGIIWDLVDLWAFC
ncbi:hypothetical protein BAE44_0015495 [Dichanthelium oligosanthes]|uniref:F-box domain-containing protein n=1 Tax=Dichanthelium oligosanthes TaxID=888268 RepID=A0A1E5VEB4_9POAL|nr:hypothetical protein BAE44_0015495 [Dichanthelium oligosanthes]